MSGHCSGCGNTFCLCGELELDLKQANFPKEEVLICKETAQLVVKTNTINGVSFKGLLLISPVLDCDGRYLVDWQDDEYESLGLL